MDWFKKSAGLKISIAIWLVILLVPISRLRAQRQWYSTEINFIDFEQPYKFQPNDRFGLQPKQQLELMQRFPNDVAAQLAGMRRFKSNDPDAETDPDPLPAEDLFEKYAQLAAKFPNDLDVRKQWLREATFGDLKIESDALMKSYGYAGTFPETKVWLSVKQQDEALKCALYGEKREPDNAFWPWMEAIFRFSSRHDEQGLIALQKAGKCSRYDDGVDATMRSRVQWMHRMQLSDWEDDMAEMYVVWMPHLAKFRAVARATMWQAKQALDRGDVNKALQISHMLQNAGSPIQSSRGALTTRLVGEALSYISWTSTLRNAKIQLPRFSGASDQTAWDARRREIAVRYAKYATQHGRPDYAQSALELQSKFAGSTLGKRYATPEFDGIPQKTKAIKQFHWVLAKLLMISICCTLLWCFAWLASCKSSLEKTVIARSMAVWAAFSIGVMGAVLVIGSMQIAKDMYDNGIYLIPSAGEQEAARAALDHTLTIASIAIVLVPVFIASLPRLKWRIRFERTGGVNWMRLIQFFIYAGLVIGTVTTAITFYESNLQTTLGYLWPSQIILAYLSAIIAYVFFVATRKGKLRIGLTFVSIGVIAVLAYLATGGLGNPIYISYLTIVALCLLSYGAFLMKPEAGVSFIKPKLAFTQVVLRIRVMAASIAVACSLFYMLVTLASIPARRDIQNATNRQLKIGEVAYIEEKMTGH